MAKTMEAIVFTGVNKMGLQEKPIPKPGVGEVLVKVEAAGICGTDPKILCGEYEGNLPLIPGHEYAGEVVELGPNVNKLRNIKKVLLN